MDEAQKLINLISSADNVVGLFHRENVEADRKKHGLPPIVPEMFRSVAARNALEDLQKALDAYKTKPEG